MESSVALGAIRRVTIDIANLTGQLALMQSGLEHVRQVAQGIMPTTWRRVIEDEGGHPEMGVILSEDQVDAVMRLLAALDSLE